MFCILQLSVDIFFINSIHTFVQVVCTEGPERVKELIAMGASFDHGEDGRLHLAREGGHSHNRIVHSADMTGREIERALLEAVDNDENISLFGHHFAIDLLTCQVSIFCSHVTCCIYFYSHVLYPFYCHDFILKNSFIYFRTALLLFYFSCMFFGLH
jgi:hypothetical protein